MANVERVERRRVEEPERQMIRERLIAGECPHDTWVHRNYGSYQLSERGMLELRFLHVSLLLQVQPLQGHGLSHL